MKKSASCKTRKDQNGWVYFIGSESSDLTKIGFSVRPRARLRQVQSGNPERLAILYAIPAKREMEERIHALLSTIRTVGEWFTEAPFVRLFGEQLMALHLVRAMDDRGFVAPPITSEEWAEVLERARARLLASDDIETALDHALTAYGH